MSEELSSGNFAGENCPGEGRDLSSQGFCYNTVVKQGIVVKKDEGIWCAFMKCSFIVPTISNKLLNVLHIYKICFYNNKSHLRIMVKCAKLSSQRQLVKLSLV